MNSAGKPGWQQLTALVSLSAGGAITGFSFVPGAAADLTAPASMPVHLLALEQAAQPAPAADAKLRSAIVNVANYYLRMAAGKTPAEMEALIWQHASADGVDHGASCAAFASLTLELAAHVVGQHSWVTGGTSYPWPLHKWADVRVGPNPASPGVVSILQDAQAHDRWHPLGDGYTPLPGDWVMFDGHVEVVTKESGGVLHTVGGDSLPNFSVNAHEYRAPFAAEGVTGFVNNGAVPAWAGKALGQGDLAGAHQAGNGTGVGRPSRRNTAPGQTGPGQTGPGRTSRGHTGSGKTSQGGTGQSQAAPATTGAGRTRPAQPDAGRPDLGAADLGSADLGSAGHQQMAIPGTSAARSHGHRPARAPGGAAIPGMPASVPSPGKHQPARQHRWQGQGRAASGAKPHSHASAGADAGAAMPGTGLPWAAAARRAAPPGTADIPGVMTSAHRHTADPAARPASAPTLRRPVRPPASAADSGTQAAFIRQIAQGAVAAQRKYGVPASVTIAQAIEESGWGRSKLATRDHNLFGIKGTGPAGSDAQPTREYENGRSVTRIASFRVYHSAAQSIDDHGNLLATSEYYRQAMSVRGDPNAFAAALTGVYATDPHYGAKLIDLMRRYDLYRYDVAAPDVTPRASAPAAGASRAATPGAGSRHIATPDAGGPGAGTPRSATPAGTPGAGSRHRATPDAGTPGAGTPHTATPAGTPGAGTPPTARPAGTPGAGTPHTATPGAGTKHATTPGSATRGAARRGSATIPGVPSGTPAPLASASSPAPSPKAAPGPAGEPGAGRPLSTAAPSAQTVSAERVTVQTLSAERVPTSTAAARQTPAQASRYRPQIPPSVRDAFLTTAKRPLMRAEPLHRDVAGVMGIPYEVLAACDWMQCEAQKRYSPVHGERLGTLNPDGTMYRTKSEALEQCADDLVRLARAVYQIDLTAAGPLSVRDLANVFAAFRWGALLKLHHTSAMEFPYSVAGLTAQHTKMRWPNIDEPNAPDKPGGRFRMPFGAVPVVLCLSYPATA